MIEETIINVLLNDSNISEIVEDKIYFYPMADTTILSPYIIVEGADTPYDYHTDGTCSIATGTMTITTWGSTKYEAVNLQNAVRNALNDYSNYDDPSAADTIIYHISITGTGDIADFSVGVSKSKKIGKRINISIQYDIE